MKVQIAVLYQDELWEEVIVDVPDICTCMTYAEINERAVTYFHSAPEYSAYSHCFGAYVTNERYDEKHICICKKQDKENLIWGILETVNEHFRDEMSDLLDRDFDELLQELAE